MFVFPGAHEAIDTLKTLGVKLALVTNGAADTQRAKVERFELAHRFDHIQIEGEHGFGKPEERAYLHAMAALGVTAARDLDDRRQSGMGGRGAAASRHLCDLDGRAWRGPAGGIDHQARPHHPFAQRITANQIRRVTDGSALTPPRSSILRNHCGIKKCGAPSGRRDIYIRVTFSNSAARQFDNTMLPPNVADLALRARPDFFGTWRRRSSV